MTPGGGATRATLSATSRLKTQQHFRRVYQRGRRAAGRWLTVVVLARADAAAGPRLGVSVSKDHGGAVRRNKLKRLLREAFRLDRHLLPPNVDVVLIPRPRDENFPLAELRAEIPALVHKALSSSQPPRERRPRGNGKAGKPGPGGTEDRR